MTPGCRRRVRRVVVSACLLLTAAVVAGLPVYVRPQIDRLRHADAMLILGGADYRRYRFGFDLGAQGWAPNVWSRTRTGRIIHGLQTFARPHTHGWTCTALSRIRRRRKVKVGSCADLLRKTAGEQSSSSRSGRTSPGPGSSWSSASTVTS